MGYLTNSGTGFMKDAVTTVSNVKSYLVNKTGYLVDAIRVGIGDFGQRVLDDGGTVEASAEAAASYREITKDIYDQASLVLFPSGYKDNLVYNHKPVDGSGNFTYTRGTDTATRVGADGYIKKERANLLEQSNQFDTTWNLSGGSTLNQNAVGIDNIPNTAWTFTKDDTFDGIKQNISLSGINTFSVYAKKIDSSVNELVLRINVAGGNRVAIFDLSDGTKVSMTSHSSAVHYDIQKAGNGWYRCSFVVSGTIANVDIRMDYNQTGTGSILVQNAQLEQGLVPNSYIETTTAPVYEGLTDNLPRIDYTGGTPSILLEPSRTNIVPISEGIPEDINSVTLTENYGTSPEGLQNSLKVQKDGVSSNDRIFPIDNYNATFVSGTNYSVSAFVKNIDVDGITTIGCRLGSGGTLFRLGYEWSGSSLAISTDYASGTRTNEILEDYGNGWWRIGFSFEADNTQGGIELDIDRDNGSATTSIETYGWQLEQGSYPTSYIPTYNASATRAADTSLKGGFISSGITTGSNFTFYIEIKGLGRSGNPQVYLEDISGNRILSLNLIGQKNRYGFYSPDASSYVSPSSNEADGVVKIAVTYDGTDFKEYFNGEEQGSITASVAVNVDEIDFAKLSSNSIAVYQAVLIPTALSVNDCEALTAL